MDKISALSMGPVRTSTVVGKNIDVAIVGSQYTPTCLREDIAQQQHCFL